MFTPVFPPPFSPFSKNRLIYNCCSVPRFCQDRGTFQNTNKSRELGTFQDFSGWNLLKSNVDFRKCLPKRAESNLVPMNGKYVFLTVQSGPGDILCQRQYFLLVVAKCQRCVVPYYEKSINSSVQNRFGASSGFLE